MCGIEAKQLQIDLNESGGSKKLDAVKSYARIINRRVSRAFSFSQDTPNKIKKTISSVFRSPFQSSYSQQSLNEQKASKLTSLASLQLTPTLMETKRKFITLQKSALPLISPPVDGAHKQNQPKRGSHTIHLLSTRTLRNLRSTTTSTINGIAAAYNSMSNNNSQSTSNFSITTSLASIHRSHKKASSKTGAGIFRKPSNAEESVSNYTNSDDEDFNRENRLNDIEYAEGDDPEEEDEDNEANGRPLRVLGDNNSLDINSENSLAVNLFPSAKKTNVCTSLKNLKNKKKLNQLLTSKASIKRHNDDTHTDTDSMEFDQSAYDSNDKLSQVKQANKLCSLLTHGTHSRAGNKKLDTL